jgi:hypothetical protein
MYVASLVLGIVAIVSFYFPIFGVVISLTALGISIASMVIRSKGNTNGSGMAVAGFVLSIIATVGSVFFTIVYIAATSASRSLLY